jgi:LysE type translocator
VFAQGYLVNLLNPKTALWFYTFLPQFVDPARGAAPAQILFFGALFVLLASCTDSCYAVLGSTLGRWLASKARVRRGQRYVTGGLYIALGVSAAVAGSQKKLILPRLERGMLSPPPSSAVDSLRGRRCGTGSSSRKRSSVECAETVWGWHGANRLLCEVSRATRQRQCEQDIPPRLGGDAFWCYSWKSAEVSAPAPF